MRDKIYIVTTEHKTLKTANEYKDFLRSLTVENLLNEFEWAISWRDEPEGAGPPDDMCNLVRNEISRRILSMQA